LAQVEMVGRAPYPVLLDKAVVVAVLLFITRQPHLFQALNL
jgi:hypothetical protein